MIRTEYFVVGGGPSGAAAAIALRKKGHEVLLVDSEKFPRVKLCGGLFTRKSQRALRTLLGQTKAAECMQACIASREKRLSLWKGAKKKLVEVQPRERIVLIDRVKFDEWMVRHFEELGGMLREEDAVLSIDYVKCVASLKSGKKVYYNTLIGADGANSKTVKWLWKHLDVLGKADKSEKESRKEKTALCVEVNADRSDCPADIEGVRIYMDVIPKSYAWSFAKGDKVCFGLIKMKDLELKAEETLRKFLRELGVKHLARYPITGARLPFGNYKKVPAWRNEEGKSCLFVGDAARLVEPLTGEGIFYALQSGIYAAESEGDVDVYLHKVAYLHQLIRKGMKYQKSLMQPRALKFFEWQAKRHPHFIEYFYSTQIEEACLDSFFKIAWDYKRGKKR